MAQNTGTSGLDGLRSRVAALDGVVQEQLAVLALINQQVESSQWAARLRHHHVDDLGSTPADLVALGLLGETVGRGERVYVVSTVVALTVLELLHEQDRLAPLVEYLPPFQYNGRERPERLATELRLAILDGDEATIEDVADQAFELVHEPELGRWLTSTLGLRPPLAALYAMPERLGHRYASDVLPRARDNLLPISDEVIKLALEYPDAQLRLDAGRLLAIRGRGERAREIDGLPPYGAEGLALLAAFWRGDHAEAARVGDAAIAAMKTRKRKALPGLEGACHVLASLATAGHDPAALAAIEAVLTATGQQRPPPDESVLHVLASMICVMTGDRALLSSQARTHSVYGSWLSTLVAAIHDVWFEQAPKDPLTGADVRSDALTLLEAWSTRARLHGYPGVAREFETTRAALAEPNAARSAEARPNLAAAFRAPSAWEAALTGLEAIFASVAPAAAVNKERERHIVWELSVYDGYGQLRPRLCSSARARKGANVSLARLLSGKLDCLSDDDRRVLAAAEPDLGDTYYGKPRRGGSRKMMLGSRALIALLGHSQVVDADGAPLRVERGQARLRTNEEHVRGDKLVSVTLEPRVLLERDVYCELEPSQGRVLIYERTPAIERAASILGAGLLVPAHGVERLNQTLTRISVAAGMTIEGDLTPAAKQVQADPRPVLLLGWDGETLSATARVAPLGLEGVHLKPGVGHPVISAQLRDAGELSLHRCERDLVDERRRFAELERGCATLMSYAEGPLDWCVPSLADALEVMLELGRLGDQIVLAWPKGKPLMPPTGRDLQHLRIDVTSGQDWLTIAATLELDERRVLSFRELIAARAGPRFIKLDERRFVALSERLRLRLDALQDLGAVQAGGLRVTAAMLPVLAELTDDLDGASFDASSRARLARLGELENAKPRRPRGFHAQLRDYQVDGYAWMWRLAEAGLGACLADDMGLGKTIQALALLSQRASKGPALVVCPTSVVHNWIAEIARFASNLRSVRIDGASDRATALERLGRRDVLVCSYGVLVSQAQSLAPIEFATAVFDEAHALKNERTKRARAASNIRAGFRLGLTGTPVENHVDELWSLYRVLVPGLLGTKSGFDKRFAKPIARGDRERSASLRTLLRPFILRRTKGQVLAELPPRTEVTLRIQPTPAERAYYEALRRRAVDLVEHGDRAKKRFRILAQITRLRQAAVDPRLLDEAAAPSGAKIDALVEHVIALRAQGHRALVFTQFLGSMALLRERFAATSVEYLELDGSTPATERARRVDAFQAGDGDVFVLSLRAGGVGMNLTGADYVLHLDPWWNPAVEDQASDRAHRIGQTRPVTVYRLVTAGTIEEKILALHETKRDLADDILAGLEGTEALDLDELMQLLGNEGDVG